VSESLLLVAQNPALWLVARVALIAMFVILVAALAERLGPFLGGMVASLPLYTGPVYFMLALEHDADYIGAAVVGSLAICGAAPVFCLAYCVVAHRFSAPVCLAISIAAWGACAAIVRSHTWTLVEALLFVTPIYFVSVALARGFTRGVALRKAERKWMDLPLRAGLVAITAGAIIWASSMMPPQLTGIFSVLPVIMSSLMMILHPRIGGAATAALFAHTLGGLVGMVAAFTLVGLIIHRVGVPVALSLGLVVTLAWNLLLILVKRLTAPPPAPAMAMLPPPRMPAPRHRAGIPGRSQR
jgi:uncharacterized membrane protein (GlpM family)